MKKVKVKEDDGMVFWRCPYCNKEWILFLNNLKEDNDFSTEVFYGYEVTCTAWVEGKDAGGGCGKKLGIILRNPMDAMAKRINEINKTENL